MATKEEQREYQRKWVAKRRADFFADKECIRCGSHEDLELDHVDPSQKISHNIWSWSEHRRLTEIAKCQILCHDCHVTKSQENGDVARGERSGKNILTETQVWAIRDRLISGDRQVDIAKDFGVTKTAVYDILHGRSWVWL